MKYCCDNDMQAYEHYYRNQCGHSLPVFYDARMQRGYGLGSIFGGLFRSFIKKYAPVIGRKALQTGVRIANDVAVEQSFKDTAKSRLFGALEKGINNFVPQAEGQSGSSIRRKRSRRRPPLRRKQAKKKKRKLDIFS